jgi:hypothetical protein
MNFDDYIEKWNADDQAGAMDAIRVRSRTVGTMIQCTSANSVFAGLAL